MAARPTLAEIAARVAECPEEESDEPTVEQALELGLQMMRSAIAGHDSGDQTPLSARLRQSAAKRTPQEQ